MLDWPPGTVRHARKQAIAFQEAENLEAAARVLDPARYTIVVETRAGEPTGTCRRSESCQFYAAAWKVGTTRSQIQRSTEARHIRERLSDKFWINTGSKRKNAADPLKSLVTPTRIELVFSP